MSQRSYPLTDDELLAYAQGKASPALAASIDEAQTIDRSLAAELALMTGLKPALGGANPLGELDWRRLEADIRRETQSARAAPVRSKPPARLAIWKAAAVVLGLVAIVSPVSALGPV